ncbi:MAG: anthranilate phosphoribosyltransferase, partial [Clostridiales bacterium]|nr:anthranilate phosphoribosyltransferase [Clostridiales bacterium]
MIKTAISDLVKLNNLTSAAVRSVMTSIMNGEASHAQIAAFLTAMRLKGETI